MPCEGYGKMNSTVEDLRSQLATAQARIMEQEDELRQFRHSSNVWESRAVQALKELENFKFIDSFQVRAHADMIADLASAHAENERLKADLLDYQALVSK